MIASRNPVNNKLEKRFKELSDKELERAVKKTDQAYDIWKRTAFTVRSKALKSAAGILKENSEKYAQIITLEMGKPIKESRAEIDKCAWVCEYYADNAKIFLKDESINTDAENSYVTFEPLGIILAIMPWNFPFWQVFRFAAPALMAGNVCLLKHASNVPQCALAIEEIFTAAQLPEGAFQSLFIEVTKAQRLVADDRVQAVTLTGSEGAGKKIGELAGKQIKKSVLELGGSDPFIILEDANLKKAAETAVKSRMVNTGQSCIAAKRFIVIESNYDRFVELVKEQIGKLKVGDPLKEDTDLGPLARQDLVDEVLKQVKDSVKKGAKLEMGGDKPFKGGAFMNPVLLTDVTPEMAAFKQEVFGPVFSVIRAKDEEHAIKLANDSRYGLGASVWTVDPERAARISRHLQAGSVFVNAMVKSDPRLPFGGIKKSGYGRELSHYGIREFVNIKTVYIEK